MKKYLLILPLLLWGGKGFSQQTAVSTQEISSNYQKAEFPGGDEAFQKEFMNMVHAYIDMALYAIQGQVTFVFNIDPKGKIDKVDVLPKFKNNEMFIDDMKYAVKKVKGKWKPAVKNGIPVDSKFVMKVTFNHNTYDHD
ncbi:TonB protein C-terminal [Chryseobacterium arachidis]|uniref:TonB protein C-terminal n=1 Tax=Chryseobacterium arachidis TaxID=1416778 RepID=A0A1M5EBK9_9FLAO|nr:energy transducer TonB [Chryseobacterium arachidis]SHF76524.1 TonB protein C-terminal [Chryseobacterium arachidis]